MISQKVKRKVMKMNRLRLQRRNIKEIFYKFFFFILFLVIYLAIIFHSIIFSQTNTLIFSLNYNSMVKSQLVNILELTKTQFFFSKIRIL